MGSVFVHRAGTLTVTNSTNLNSPSTTSNMDAAATLVAGLESAEPGLFAKVWTSLLFPGLDWIADPNCSTVFERKVVCLAVARLLMTKEFPANSSSNSISNSSVTVQTISSGPNSPNLFPNDLIINAISRLAALVGLVSFRRTAMGARKEAGVSISKTVVSNNTTSEEGFQGAFSQLATP